MADCLCSMESGQCIFCKQLAEKELARRKSP